MGVREGISLTLRRCRTVTDAFTEGPNSRWVGDRKESGSSMKLMGDWKTIYGKHMLVSVAKEICIVTLKMREITVRTRTNTIGIIKGK